MDCGDECVVWDEDLGGKVWGGNIFQGIRSCLGGKRLRLSAVWMDNVLQGIPHTNSRSQIRITCGDTMISRARHELLAAVPTLAS